METHWDQCKYNIQQVVVLAFDISRGLPKKRLILQRLISITVHLDLCIYNQKLKSLITDCFIDARFKSSPTLISTNNATVSVTNCHFSRFKSKRGPTVILGMNNSQISIANTSIVKDHGLFGTLFITDGCSIAFASVLTADNVADYSVFSTVHALDCSCCQH